MTENKKPRTTSYWRNGGLREKLKVSPFFVATAFYISFFVNLVNNKKLLLKLVKD